MKNIFTKKKSNYYREPGELCKKNCTQPADHEGECICQKSKKQHICNKDCKYKNIANVCKQYFILSFGHKGTHKCGIKIHLCKNECSLYRKTKTKNSCLRNCCLPYNHSGI